MVLYILSTHCQHWHAIWNLQCRKMPLSRSRLLKNSFFLRSTTTLELTIDTYWYQIRGLTPFPPPPQHTHTHTAYPWTQLPLLEHRHKHKHSNTKNKKVTVTSTHFSQEKNKHLQQSRKVNTHSLPMNTITPAGA